MKTPMLFGREPALWIQGLTALLAVLVAVPGGFMNDALAAVVTSAAVALFATWQALLVRPVAPTVFTGAIAAFAPLFAYFGLDATQTQVGLFTAAVAAVFGLITRQQSTPNDDPSGATV